MWSVGSVWEHTPLADFQMTAIDHDGPHIVEPRVVPEPATVLVLGLGGLLLRRKKSV